MHFDATNRPIDQALASVADAEGQLSYYDFSQIALYHPQVGYYIKVRKRVGRDATSDFYTSSSFRECFQAIVVEASQGLARTGEFDASQLDFVEIGSEPGSALLDSSSNPFRSTRSIRVGEEIRLEGQLVVFSNELFDAQPFHSFVFRDGAWLEVCVQLPSQKGERVREATRPVEASSPHAQKISLLPSPAPEGYRIDWPTGSLELMQQIARQPWRGIFLALDYGKTWTALTRDTPQGTARAYSRHRQKTDLLENIGEQDLTTHICWDWLEEALAKAGFTEHSLLSQEAFIVKCAPKLVQRAFAEPGGTLQNQLRPLMLPTFMGQKFQVLSAIRLATPTDE